MFAGQYVLGPFSYHISSMGCKVEFLVDDNPQEFAIDWSDAGPLYCIIIESQRVGMVFPPCCGSCLLVLVV